MVSVLCLQARVRIRPLSASCRGTATSVPIWPSRTGACSYSRRTTKPTSSCMRVLRHRSSLGLSNLSWSSMVGRFHMQCTYMYMYVLEYTCVDRLFLRRCVRVFRGRRSGAGRRGGHGISDDSRADGQPLSVVLLPRGRPERQPRPLRDPGRERKRVVAHARCSLVQN